MLHPLPRALAVLVTAVLVTATTSGLLFAEEIPPTSALPAIFNGRDLTGWKPPAESHWKVVDGILVGENDAEKKGSMLYTERAYGDVILEGEVRWNGEIDSGFMLRKPELQLQIGVSRSLKRDMTCSFYVGNYPEEAQAKRAAELLKAGDWNRIRIRAEGDTFTVWLNGEQVSNYVDAAYPTPYSVGLQIHGGLKMKVEYRDIQVAELK